MEQNSKEHVAEFRTNGCQSVIRGIHPETRKPYRWLVDAKPAEITWAEINWPAEWVRVGDTDTPTPKTKPKSDTRNFEGNEPLKACLADHILELCQELFPDGRQEGEEWRIGNVLGEEGQSLGIDLSREKAGLWYEFNGEVGGGFPELLAKARGITRKVAFELIEKRYPAYFKKAKSKEWLKALRTGAVEGKDFAQIKITPRKRLLDLWFREGDTGFVYSARGVGKTMLAYGMALAISRGERFGPWVGGDQAVPVVYLDGEMPVELMQERHKGLGPPGEKFYLLSHEILFDRTGQVLNIADPIQQQAITSFCEEKEAKVLFLDNLSTLASGVAEDKADDWEKLLGWLLNLRRKHIAVVIVHHAGRSGLMRGTSRREDSVFWIIKLEVDSDFKEAGCRFLQRFEKNRNAPRDPDAYIWTFKAQLGNPRIEVTYEPCTLETMIVDRLRAEKASAKTLASEFKLHISTIYRALSRLVDNDTISKKGSSYYVPIQD